MAEKSVASMPSSRRSEAIRANRWVYTVAKNWMLGFSVIFGLYVGLPFLAPVFMAVGLELPARVIYTIYSFLCHQLPQRSWFLFGTHFTYPLAAIESVWPGTSDMTVLRQFIGTPSMGWKVAWSDRMVSMYTSILIFAWIWYPLRRRFPKLSWQWLALLMLPLALDGASHFVSDLAGMGQGFRDTNFWLAALTGQAFSTSFYAGDGWGSFNSIMRLVTGILFGAGIAWFGLPYFEEFFADLEARIRYKFTQAGISL